MDNRTTGPDLEVGLLADDLAKQRVGYLRLYDRRGFWERTTHPTHYMITDLFIDEYWGNFPDNSLVYIDGCGVLTFGSVLNAISRKNNPVVFGWTRVVTVGVMQATSQFVFDRLLGANMFEAETPPQRPFDYIRCFWNTSVSVGGTDIAGGTGLLLNSGKEVASDC